MDRSCDRYIKISHIPPLLTDSHSVRDTYASLAIHAKFIGSGTRSNNSKRQKPVLTNTLFYVKIHGHSISLM